MKSLYLTFTDKEFEELTNHKNEVKAKNWRDYVLKSCKEVKK